MSQRSQSGRLNVADPDSRTNETVETRLDEAVSEIGTGVESVERRAPETHLDTDGLGHEA